MAVDAKISKLVKNQFPDFYKEEGENFLAFIEAYYEYMEQNGKMTDAIRNLESYQDIATTTDDFIKYFINTFLPSVPLDVAADKKLMVKYINQFNQARGTLGAYRLLFRALYNENIEVEYPADQILKVSDGDWRKERYLVSAYDPETYNFIGKSIKGTESQAEALVEDIVRKNIRGRDIMQILLSNIKGKFNNLEPIRLLSDTAGTGHTTIVEAGIDNVTILSPGGEYRQGDVVDLISADKGLFGKVVVTETEDLGGTLTFSLVEGGSGYTTSIGGGTFINFSGGDGTDPASFQIGESDIVDRFAIAINTNLVGSNTVYGSGAPTVTFADGLDRKMTTFANTLLSAVDYGFPEDGEEVGNKDFRDHANAILRIANTQDISVGDSLFGLTSGANATVLQIVDNTSSNTVVRIDGYKNFSTASGGETIRFGFANSSGTDVGTVISFSGNTIGYHVLEIGNTAGNPILEGQEVVGVVSNAFGVIKKVLSDTANGYTQGVGGADDRNLVVVQVAANNSANLTSQFDTGPMKSFLDNEGLRLVNTSTVVGNAVFTTSNTQIENIYTKLSDAFNFETTTFGTIASLALPVGGSGFSVAPTIEVRENDIAALGIGEAYLTLQSNDPNWGTGNSSFESVDTNDRLVQTSSGASGDVKGGLGTSTISRTVYANGTYEMVVRVWQDFLQRSPGNINWANNETLTINIYDSSYVPGTEDTRTVADTGTAKIVNVEDRGILGENALVTAGVGANGTITGVRVLDSGFAYRDNEIVLIEATDRNLATSARVQVSLGGAANSEGYYATSRSHVSTLRGYIQDSHYYQEYSYQIISPISLDRYRDYALELIHPAGQALFGKYRTQSNVQVDIVSSSNNVTRLQAAGTVALSNGSFEITGSNTSFLSEYSNNETIIVEYAHKQFYTIPLNIVSNDTTANLTIAWSNTSISGANAFYYNGSM